MRLSEATPEKLQELFELIINEKLQHEFSYYWNSQEEFYYNIRECAKQEGFDGDLDNYDAKYWYFKGKNNTPAQQPKQEEQKQEPQQAEKPIKTDRKTLHLRYRECCTRIFLGEWSRKNTRMEPL